MYWFTADEHYFHVNKKGTGIIDYQKRPFKDIIENNEVIIKNHNEVVQKSDITIHVGDFALCSTEKAMSIIRQLNGNHIFIKGSHDSWLKTSPFNIISRWTRRIGEQLVVADHYAGRCWESSHYGSIQVHGHNHGKLPPFPNQYDVGVDNNNFYPISFDELLIKLGKKNENDKETV